MNRYLFENIFGIEGWNIAWYGLIIACGMILGFLLAVYRSRYTGIRKDDIYDYTIIAIPVCIICARAYYVIFEWEQYKENLWEILAINKGGLAIYGGIIGGFIIAMIFCEVKRISFLSFADTLLPSLVLGQSIGRWGNFVNQEAYGNIITNPNLHFFPYGVFIENTHQWHQATFFYESFGNTLLLGVMLISYPNFKRKGYMLPMYMIGYGIIRFTVEGLRTDSLYLAPGLRVSQCLSLFLIVFGGVFLALIRRTQF